MGFKYVIKNIQNNNIKTDDASRNIKKKINCNGCKVTNIAKLQANFNPTRGLCGSLFKLFIDGLAFNLHVVDIVEHIGQKANILPVAIF